jgi:formate dehydrogenase maturation protein FdhE
MTYEAKHEYMRNPDHCPYCKSQELWAEHTEHDTHGAWRLVKCQDCSKDWREVFTFTRIEETNEN